MKVASTYRCLYCSLYKGTPTPYWKVMEFESEGRCVTCKHHWMLIKNNMESINRKYCDGHNHGQTAETAALKEWLKVIAEYVELYGDERVPLDIRESCNQVQKYIGVAETAFGPDTGVLTEDERLAIGNPEGKFDAIAL